MGLQAMLAPDVNTEIDALFYKRMGLTLTVGFILWIVLSFLVYFIIKSKPVDDRFRIMTLFLYYPVRLSLLVWAPWLGFRAGQDWSDASEKVDLLDSYEMVN